jgi:hypothetical protein
LKRACENRRIWRARESPSPELKTLVTRTVSLARVPTRRASHLAARDPRGVTWTYESTIGSTCAKRERVSVRTFFADFCRRAARLEFEPASRVRTTPSSRSSVSAREARGSARECERPWPCVGSQRLVKEKYP